MIFFMVTVFNQVDGFLIAEVLQPVILIYFNSKTFVFVSLVYFESTN